MIAINRPPLNNYRMIGALARGDKWFYGFLHRTVWSILLQEKYTQLRQHLYGPRPGEILQSRYDEWYQLSDVRPRIGVPRIGASERSIVPLSVRWPRSRVDSPRTHMHSIRVWQSFCYLWTVLHTLSNH